MRAVLSRPAGAPSASTSRGFPFAGRVLVSLTAGAAAALAFPPYSAWWLLPLAVAGLSLAVLGCSPRRGFVLGLVFGLVFMAVLLPWLRVIGADAWLGLSLLEAAFYGVLGWGLARVGRLPAWPLWQACLWVAVETLRGTVPWGGFNWGRLAFATVDAPVANAVTYLGAAGVSFLVALVGTTLAWALHPPLRPRRLAVGGAALLLSAAPALLPSWDPPAGTDTVMVAVVQGNVPGEGMDAFAERRVVLDNHVQATLDLAARVEAGEEERPDLVLWPENSTDIDPFRDPTVHADIQRAVDAVAVPVLVGAMVGGPGPIDVRNQGIVWLPESGPATSYSKKHPVPFGEYIPMRKVLAEYFERLDQIPRDMVPGTDPGAMDMGAATVGDVICFEVIYDDLIRDVVRGGADFLVVQTNNATYMGTGQVDQQFAIARLRALETRRYVAVAATNGISAFVDPDAAVVDRAPKRTQEVMVREVARLDEQTPAVRYGAWVEGGLSAAGALAVVAGGLAGVLAARRGRAEQEQA